MAHYISNRFLRSYQTLLRERGHEPSAVFATLGFSESMLSTKYHLIDIVDFGQLLEYTVKLKNAADIGHALAQAQDLTVLGSLVDKIALCANVGELLVIIEKHIHLIVPSLSMTVEHSEFKLSINLTSSIGALNQSAVFQEYVVTLALQCLGQLLPNNIPVRSIYFQANECDFVSPQALQSYFATPVGFGKAVTQVNFPTQLAQQKIPKNTQWLTTSFNDSLAEEDLIEQVSELVGIGLANQTATLPHIARVLGKHPRKLQRDLAFYGVNFNTILQNVRMHYAYELICKTSHDLNTIALMLGYKHGSGLSAHIRKWFGASLVQLRKNERLHRFAKGIKKPT